MDFPFYSTICQAIVNENTRLYHPVTGEKYGKTDFYDESKLSEIGAVPLRIEPVPANFLQIGWEIIEDDESTDGVIRRPTGYPLRIEYPPEDYVATGWEIVDDDENSGGKLKRPTGIVAIPDVTLDAPTEAQSLRILDKNFRPLNILFYYGYPNSFNSAVNGWVNEMAAKDMAVYDLVVLGDGVQNPSHPDYANTEVIIPRIRVLNPNIQLFGYVACTDSLENFKSKVDQWNDLQAHGIFIDQAGYDFGTTRTEFNERVKYIHDQEYANVCFVNSWNPDHVLGLAEDASYLNSEWNENDMPSKLQPSDWLLLESFPINTTAYSGTGGYESKTDWLARGQKAVDLRRNYGIQLAAVGIINDDNANGQDLFNFGYISALMWALEAYGSSSASYGASTAQVKFWVRPDNRVRSVYDVTPVVTIDVNHNDVYSRFVQNSMLTVDFTSSAQTSGPLVVKLIDPTGASDVVQRVIDVHGILRNKGIVS